MKILFLTIAMLLSYFTQAGNRRPVVTLVTGLWDVGRAQLKSGYKRTYQYYLRFYKQLLQTDSNLIAFGNSQLKQFTAENRAKPNTLFIQKELSQVQKYWYIHKVRSATEYLKSHPNQFDWQRFKQLPSYGLQMYNPVVMSKLLLINEALHKDIFDSEYFVWVDGGLLHSFQKEALLRHSFQKMIEYYQIDWFLRASPKFGWMTIQLGFRKESLSYRTQDPLEIPQANCWANWMGGKVIAASTVLAVYQNLLRITLQNNEIYIDQSIFTLMLQRYPYLLTKLDMVKPEQYVKFEAKRLDYKSQIQMERYYNFRVNRNKPSLYQDSSPFPLKIIKTSFYNSIIDSIHFSTYKNALILRILILAGTIAAYILIKFCYLNQNNIVENEFIEIESNQNQQ